MAFEFATLRDSFTRADEGPPMTGWAAWGSPGLKVVSNQCAPADGVDNSGYYSTAMTGSDVEAYVTIATQPITGSDTAIFARLDPGASFATSYGYGVTHEKLAGTDNIEIQKLVAGVYTSITGPHTQELVDGDKLGIRCVGTTIEAWAFTSGVWVLVASVVDTSVTGTGSQTRTALYQYGNGSTSARFDDFYAGTVLTRALATAAGKVGKPTLGLRKGRVTWLQTIVPVSPTVTIAGVRAAATLAAKASSPKIQVSPHHFKLVVTGDTEVADVLTATYTSSLAYTAGGAGSTTGRRVTGVRALATAAGKVGAPLGSPGVKLITGVRAEATVSLARAGVPSVGGFASTGIGIDLLHQNYAAITGGTVVLGALSVPTNGLRMSSVGAWVVPDSVSSSLTVADAADGGAAMSGWLRVSAWPATTQTIIGKTGAYELKMNSTGHLLWTLTNGANTVTVTSAATLATNAWYHVAPVYNGDYTGPTTFGKITTGTALARVEPDSIAGVNTGNNNLQVCQAEVFERGVLDSITMDLKRGSDSPYSQWIGAVIFSDLNGEPDQLLAQAEGRELGDNAATRAWFEFPLTCPLYPGDYWIGYVGGANLTGELAVLFCGRDTTGGVLRGKVDPVTASDFQSLGAVQSSFGTATLTSDDRWAIYGSYTAARTGDEGFALIYINGQLDASTAYTHGIADTATNLQHPTGVAVDLDDWAIFDHKLTGVQVATHYANR